MDYPFQLAVPDGRRPDEDLTRNVSTVAVENPDTRILPSGTEPSGGCQYNATYAQKIVNFHYI